MKQIIVILCCLLSVGSVKAVEIKPCDAARIIVRLSYIEWSCANLELTDTGKKFLNTYRKVPRWRSCEKQEEDKHSAQVRSIVDRQKATLAEAYKHVCLIDALAFKKITGKDFARVVK